MPLPQGLVTVLGIRRPTEAVAHPGTLRSPSCCIWLAHGALVQSCISIGFQTLVSELEQHLLLALWTAMIVFVWDINKFNLNHFNNGVKWCQKFCTSMPVQLRLISKFRQFNWEVCYELLFFSPSNVLPREKLKLFAKVLETRTSVKSLAK